MKTIDRFRFRGDPVSEVSTVTQSKYSSSTGQTVPWAEYSYPVKDDYAYTAGQDIVGFHKLKRSGVLLPHTKFRQFEVKGSAIGDATTTHSNGDSYTFDGNAPQYDGWRILETQLKVIEDDLDVDYYVQQAAARIYSNGWDALTFMAELTKTLYMVKGFTKKLVDLIRNPHKFVDDAADLWLEGRYGWRTLYFDMKDIEKLILNLDGERRRYSERAGHKMTYSDEESYVQTWGSSTNTYSILTTYKVGMRGSVVADIDPPQFGFNPITTGYELITLSFVLDWIINVGQWLESMSFLALAREHYAAEGVMIEAHRTCDLVNVAFNSPWSGSRSTSGSSVAKLTSRTPTSVSLTPQLELRLDLLKGLDILALVKQALTRRK